MIKPTKKAQIPTKRFSMVQKANVEITEKPKTPEQEAMDKLLSSMEKPVQPPPISETLDKAEQALVKAAKAKIKPVRQTWYCTDCGGAHIQMDGLDMGLGHIYVDVLDGDFVDEAGNPLTGQPLTIMTDYAAPKAACGEGHNSTSNRQTLSKIKELK